MIGGFIIQGPYYKEIVIRAIGPELTRYGVPKRSLPHIGTADATGALMPLTMTGSTRSSAGIITIDEVSGSGPAAMLRQTQESAIIAVLPPGNYLSRMCVVRDDREELPRWRTAMIADSLGSVGGMAVEPDPLHFIDGNNPPMIVCCQS